MPVHKLYIDSRAAKEGDPSSFTWTPDRPLMVEKSRAFIDSVHMVNSHGTINATNRCLYATEEMPDWRVSALSNRIYLTENGVQRLVVIPTAAYSTGAALASAVATALTSGTVTYTATFTANASKGIITLFSTATSFTVSSRKSLQAMTSFPPNYILDQAALLDAATSSGQLPRTLFHRMEGMQPINIS